MEKIKEFLGKLTGKTKKLIIIGVVGVVAFAVIVAVVLNTRPYAVLFSDLNQEEAQQIIGQLQEMEVDYQYQGSNILVKQDILEKTKAQLVVEGYPKSGFTYDVFKDNAGLMTTDSDKKAFALYDLQDRIGATIKMFDGVEDAKVNIALGEEQKYALAAEDEAAENTASAVATVFMENGGSPTKEQAQGIQRLISRSIPKLTFENVSVIDSSGNEISADTSSGSAASGQEGSELSQILESQMESKVLTLLNPIYGTGNVKAAAKAKINMEQLVRESIEYTTPEKIDRNDKTGIVESETNAAENSTGTAGTGGVAGTDANADVAQYNTNGTGTNSTYTGTNTTKEYLVNQIKEQGQVNPGVLEDLTVAVTINGETPGEVNVQELQSLIGNATGIAAQDQRTKITIVSTPFYKADTAKPVSSKTLIQYAKDYMVFIIIGVVLFIFLMVLMTVLRKKKKKKKRAALVGSPVIKESVINPETEHNEEILNLQNEKGMELKQNVRDFADENPEISAQLIKNWLNGGDQNGSA